MCASSAARVPLVLGSAAPAAAATGSDEHKPKTPPPDLPSLLLDSRIVYLGMPLVPAVTELLIAELLYLQYKDRKKDVYIYINSTGSCRADGEGVGFETEATAIFDTMNYVTTPINTVGVGVAIGQSCMLLSAGTHGKRYMLPHATAMLHQPRIAASGPRQATELQIRWKEVLAQKKAYLDILAATTGKDVDVLDKDMQRPKYMQPVDCVEYGIIDRILEPQNAPSAAAIVGEVKSGEKWDSEAGLVRKPMQ